MGRKQDDVRKPKEHICIITPTLENTIGAGVSWLLSQSVIMSYRTDSPYLFTQKRVSGVKPVEYMWNTIAQRFLETDATRLWKIDNDMYPLGGDNVFELLKVDADIVAGMFFRYIKSGDMPSAVIELCAYDVEPGTNIHRAIRPDPKGPAIVDADAVGGGCMIIRRRVLEDKRMWLDDEYTALDGSRKRLRPGTDAPPIFRRLYAANGMVIKSADLDFCARARALGYTIKAHLGVPLDQKVTIGLNGIVAAWPTQAHGGPDGPVPMNEPKIVLAE